MFVSDSSTLHLLLVVLFVLMGCTACKWEVRSITGEDEECVKLRMQYELYSGLKRKCRSLLI